MKQNYILPPKDKLEFIQLAFAYKVDPFYYFYHARLFNQAVEYMDFVLRAYKNTKFYIDNLPTPFDIIYDDEDSIEAQIEITGLTLHQMILVLKQELEEYEDFITRNRMTNIIGRERYFLIKNLLTYLLNICWYILSYLVSNR